LAPSGKPWKIEERGNRISAAAKESPKNHDRRMDIEKHPQIAAHEYERAEDDSPRQQA
jgi:hypothetical protein